MASVISASTTSATALNMSADTTGVLQLATGATPTTAVTIDTSQNVGIGTASPAYRIDAFTNATSTTVGANTVAAFYSNGNGYDSNIRFGDNVNSNIRLGYISGSMYMYTNGAERMRIDTSGNVLVGATSEPSASISGVKIVSPIVAYSRFSAGNNNGDIWHIGFLNGNGLVGRIATNGTATSYVTSSDYRLKENVQPMIGALDTVAKLNPVTFTWKTDGSDGQGFIAHELQAIVPDCVSGEKDAVDAEGNIKPQGVDTSFLVATLTAAIQEQQTIINDLKARVTALEAK